MESKTHVKWIVCPECKQASCLVFQNDKLIKYHCDGEFPLFGRWNEAE